MFRKNQKRAILLISVLFISVVVLIFVQASFALAPGALSRTQNDVERGAAERAAQSGLDWVRSRLSSDPTWCANQTTVQTYEAPGLRVSEGHGQVLGWLRDGENWSRFRLRFNYQDGGPVAGSGSDDMADPPTAWTDMPYLSCNNLQGASQRNLPLAGEGSQSVHSGPWPNTQLVVPPATLLLSIEGATGRTSSENPDQFYGTVHRRTVQALLKFGSNQPVTDSAISSSGNLDIDLFGGTLQLDSLGGQTARLRSKDGLSVGAVNSTHGELRAAGTMSTGALTNVTTGTDHGPDGFYKIPLSKVRTPAGGLTLPAGTYVVTATNTVMYYPMNYSDFVNASPPPTGTPVTLPSGMELNGPNPTAPKFRLTVSQDLAINAAGAVTDFALIPDGGAAQSTDYGGLPATPPSLSPVKEFANWLTTGPTDIAPSTAAKNAWLEVLNQLPYGSSISADNNYYNYWLSADHTDHVALPISSPYLAILTNTDTQPMLTAFLQAGVTRTAALIPFYPTYTGAVPESTEESPTVPTGPSKLKPSDLELNLQGSGSSGLTLGNNHGSITLGSQVQGHGAALVSSKDISLIGTSSEFTSTPGEALGLNLYAQGTINIDAFKLDADSGTFRNITMKGILYAWQGVNIFAGNSGSNSRFDLTGEMVAYGGDPTGPPVPGVAKTTIHANNSTIIFDPSYVANLLESGPFSFQILAWHEF
ncbi:MAG: hypothetical protein KF760_32300 [Candidatus Eremiobacteraeota bacterium]|nr:hypothetical protein [Candidatus Eremiobacteraeota bacterium]MCW5871592.1 hypothetical protein [Candidatus Eremiobacteraeota bacterium]